MEEMCKCNAMTDKKNVSKRSEIQAENDVGTFVAVSSLWNTKQNVRVCKADVTYLFIRRTTLTAYSQTSITRCIAFTNVKVLFHKNVGLGPGPITSFLFNFALFSSARVLLQCNWCHRATLC